MGAGELCCKSISGIFTFIFTLGSIALMAVSGLVTYVVFSALNSETLRKYNVGIPPIVIFVLAVLLFVAIFMACCAMCQGSICCLETYSVILLLLAIGNIAIGAYTLVTFKTDDTQGLYKQINNDLYYALHHGQTGRMDFNQFWFQCCGVQDYKREYIQANIPIPKSCCGGDDVPVCTNTTNSFNKDGCTFNAFHITTYVYRVLGWSAIVVGIAEAAAVIAAFCLSCVFWRERYDW